MITVSVHEAKANLSTLLRAVEQRGERVIILKHGVAIAEIIPLPHEKRTQVHPELKDIKILYNPTETTESEWESA
jgi:prevent-host-death family protein